MKIIQQTNMTPTQMMGYTIIARTGEVIVIDGGTVGDTGELKRVIKKAGGHVALWLLTHPHDDHYGAMIGFINEPDGITVDKFCESYVDTEWARTANVHEEVERWNEISDKMPGERVELEIGQTFFVGSIKVEVLAVKNPEIKINPINNQSCVFRLTEDGFTLLILGDLGAEAGRKLMASGADLKADCVQLAHHGQGGVSEEFYDAVKPKYCLWATPAWLWYNYNYLGDGAMYEGPFKTRQTVAWLKKHDPVNVLNFEYTVVFDTDTKNVEKF